MAITFLEQKKTQRNLIFVLIGVFLITAFVIWQGFFKKETGIPFPKGEKPVPQEIKIDFEILKNPLLQSLQPFPEIEPFQESTATAGNVLGRENPFTPY